MKNDKTHYVSVNARIVKGAPCDACLSVPKAGCMAIDIPYKIQLGSGKGRFSHTRVTLCNDHVKMLLRTLEAAEKEFAAARMPV